MTSRTRRSASHSPLGCALVWSSYSVMSRLAVAAVPSASLALPCFITAALACVCSLVFEGWTTPLGARPWIALVLLGLGPVGAAFLIWDIGMKRGNVAYLGVLGYASPVISTGLLILLGLASPSWSLAIAVRADPDRRETRSARAQGIKTRHRSRGLNPLSQAAGRRRQDAASLARTRHEPAHKGRAGPAPSQRIASARSSFRPNQGSDNRRTQPRETGGSRISDFVG